MNDDARSRLESFFQYADELNLGPFYVRRGSSPSAAFDATAPAPAAALSAVQATGAVVSADTGERAAEAASRKGFSAPMTMPSPQPRNFASAVRTSTGLSLFEERVENDSLERIRADIGDCKRCKLHKARTNIVFGVGNPKAELVFVGEGPGHDEDVQGEPFVGRAGKLLTQMIEAMGLQRQDVYICNVVKCRPPENRLPERDEIETCSPFLIRQLAVIQPKVICCLGACSAQTLLETNQGISRFRGEWFEYRGAKLIATYHPAYLLRNPAAKSEVWKDLQKIMASLGLKPKPRR